MFDNLSDKELKELINQIDIDSPAWLIDALLVEVCIRLGK